MTDPVRPHPPPWPTTAATADAVRERVARRVAARLEAGAAELPREVHERLRATREQALARAQARRQAMPRPTEAVVGAGSSAGARGATLALAGSGRAGPDRPRPGFWPWLGLVPLAVLLGGLLLIHDSTLRARAHAAAAVDAALLADDLPPVAYGDPAFVEYLNAERP